MDSDGWLEAKFATYTFSPREKNRSLSAAGAIFGVILRVCMRNILVGAAGELRFDFRVNHCIGHLLLSRQESWILEVGLLRPCVLRP